MAVDLVARPVETAIDVQLLREIRNASAGTFSHDNSQISELAQRAWWVAMRGRVRAWLYCDGENRLVGYGLLRQDAAGRWWNSVAVLPACRGLGYGSAITTDLPRRHAGEVWASVRRDNAPGLAMHHEQVWQRMDDEDDNLVYFRSHVHMLAHLSEEQADG